MRSGGKLTTNARKQGKMKYQSLHPMGQNVISFRYASHFASLTNLRFGLAERGAPEAAAINPMRARFENVQTREDSSLRCERLAGEGSGAAWHSHPEVELLLVENHGTGLVGDSVAPFRQGHLVLVGPNLPHVWINGDAAKSATAEGTIGIVIQFREEIFGRALWTAPEFSGIATLLHRARRGVQFGGSEAVQAALHVHRLAQSAGVPQLTELLLLLDVLARASNHRMLATSGYVPRLNRGDTFRLNLARTYVSEHLTGRIEQPAVAALVRLSPANFSRFFRRAMGCTFSAYVNQLRLDRAMQLVLDERMTISEACFSSGFNNLSNFNRHFRLARGISPRAYLRRLRSGPSSVPPTNPTTINGQISETSAEATAAC
jgi:AraC-like DNA-binding protein